MVQVIYIIVGLISIGMAIVWPVWAWLPLAISLSLLLLMLNIAKRIKLPHVPELSDNANEMLKRYGHFYHRQFVCTDFSSATSMIQFASVVVGIIGAFKGFYWGLGIMVVFWVICANTAVAFNPSNFIRKSNEKEAHEEIFAWLRNNP